MALANVAELFYRTNLRVLMVDWDLEAPGLERFFYPNPQEAMNHAGVIDMLLGYKAQVSKKLEIKSGEPLPFEKPECFTLDVHGDGRLRLLPAGRRSLESYEEYANKVLSFDWADFDENWEGESYFRWLREEFLDLADVVLIDSRTGLTEMGGVCTYHLADIVVLFTTASRQSIDGTSQMLLNFKRPEVEKVRGWPIETLVIPTRIDVEEHVALNTFSKEYSVKYLPFMPQGLANDPFGVFGVPYIPKYSYQESLAVGEKEKDEAVAKRMRDAYSQITFALARLAPEGSKIRATIQEEKQTISGSSLVSGNIGGTVVLQGTEGHITTDTISGAVSGAVVGGNQFVTVVQTPVALPALHQLPPPPADFAGREKELAELRWRFEKGATVLGIRGQGGIGKTALALKLAEALTPQFPDAQFYINMGGTSDSPLSPAEAMTHVIRAYRPNDKLPETEAELRPLYRSVLSGQRALLLLDDVAGREQVAPLIPPTPCVLLLTSRAYFALPGLQAVTLSALSPEEAVALLATIAGIDPANAQEALSPLREIAELCGYLPLALRAAASLLAEVPDLSPEAYARELADARARLELTGTKAEGVELSVEASFTSSYDRLPPETQSVFAALAVFPDSFDAAAEEAVCADPGHRQLSDLVRRSLVSYTPATGKEGLYRLDNLARAYAATRVSPTARAEAARRHARHYAGVLRTANDLYLRGHEGVQQGLALADQEWPNIQAGQAWAAAQCGDSDEAAQLCIDYASAGAILDLRLHPAENIGWLESGLKAAGRLKNLQAQGAHLASLGMAHGDLGDMGKAIDYFEKALAIDREIGDRGAEGDALASLGVVYANLGETHKAIASYEQALTIAREIGARRGEGTALGNLGLAYADLGETRKAIAYYEQALTIAQEIGDQRGEGITLGNLGIAYANLGDTRNAIEYYQQALITARAIGDRRGEGYTLSNLGLAYANLGNPHDAVSYYESALAIAREIGDRRGEGAALGNLGLAYGDLGDTDKAIAYFEQALAIDRETGDRGAEGYLLGNLGIAYANLGETPKAIAYYEQALITARDIGDRRSEGSTLGNLGLAYINLGESSKAIDYYQQALTIARETGDRRSEGNTLWNLSRALDAAGNPAQALTSAESALSILEQIESPYAQTVRKQLEDWRARLAKPPAKAKAPGAKPPSKAKKRARK